MKHKIKISFDYRRVMLKKADSIGVISNKDAPVSNSTRVLMDVMCDIYDTVAERKLTPEEKAIFDMLYRDAMPIIRQELAEHFEIVSEEYPPFVGEPPTWLKIS